MTDKDGEIGTNKVFDILANDHRRRLLFSLLEHDTAYEIPAVDGAESDRRKTALQLYHAHLPKLAEADLIRWERDGNQIWKGPAFEAVGPLLELLKSNPEKLPDDFASSVSP